MSYGRDSRGMLDLSLVLELKLMGWVGSRGTWLVYGMEKMKTVV